jgi:hypothetical protein
MATIAPFALVLALSSTLVLSCCILLQMLMNALQRMLVAPTQSAPILLAATPVLASLDTSCLPAKMLRLMAAQVWL